MTFPGKEVPPTNDKQRVGVWTCVCVWFCVCLMSKATSRTHTPACTFWSSHIAGIFTQSVAASVIWQPFISAFTWCTHNHDHNHIKGGTTKSTRLHRNKPGCGNRLKGPLSIRLVKETESLTDKDGLLLKHKWYVIKFNCQESVWCRPNSDYQLPLASICESALFDGI